MTRAFIWIALVACSAPASSPTTPTTPPPADAAIAVDATTVDAMPASPLEVTWAPTRTGKRIRIDYTIRNHSDQTFVLCDQMRDTKGATDLAVVRPSGTDGIVAFTLAFVPPDDKIIIEKQPRPIAHSLAPNETATGIAYVDLPIHPQHPLYEPTYTIPRGIQRAVLEIGYVDNTRPLETEKLRGQSYEVPDWAALHSQKLALGDVMRLP